MVEVLDRDAVAVAGGVIGCTVGGTTRDRPR
jgi:hypothetical protein